jgi:ferrous iron transport protein A
MQNGIMSGNGSAAKTAIKTAPLGLARKGFRGRIDTIATADAGFNGKAAELERRLLELGFVEGAHVEILHEGPLGRDPIAVRVNDTTIALRRREAMAVLVA